MKLDYEQRFGGCLDTKSFSFSLACNRSCQGGGWNIILSVCVVCCESDHSLINSI
uniref:Uncharacterized protein n=1 Tax=Octopus bimaculoides TaxID=37653 RepID=A0A0L8GIG7_OCTBM